MEETAPMVTVPKIEVYGPGDLNRLRPFVFEGEIGTQIEEHTPFEKLHKELNKESKALMDKLSKEWHRGSITLRDQAALFQLYLLSELGEAPELPEEVKGVLDYLFNRPGSENVTNDACDYKNGRNLKKAKDTDRSVRWVVQPERFERAGYKWKAVGGEEHFILVPETGYVELTVDGAYRPDTGTPFSTVDSREEALQSWVKRGFDPEFAKKAVSYFLSQHNFFGDEKERQGTAAVGHVYRHADSGRFVVDASFEPDYWVNCGIGVLPARRTLKQ